MAGIAKQIWMKKEYKPLIDELFQMAYECNKDYGISGKLGLGNMWANINPTYSYNKTHTHPNSTVVRCLLY